jgi:hypothetical protein
MEDDDAAAGAGVNLARTKDGVVHDRDCRYAATGRQWEWAVNKPKERVLAVIITMGYRMCLHCHPLREERHG